MYPSLTSIGSGSRWYSKKQTPQESLLEITYLEEKLVEKRLNDIQVGVPILIRGKPTVASKISNIEKEDERDDIAEEEEIEDNFMEEEDDEASSNNNYNNSDPYNLHDPEVPPSPDYSQYESRYPSSSP